MNRKPTPNQAPIGNSNVVNCHKQPAKPATVTTNNPAKEPTHLPTDDQDVAQATPDPPAQIKRLKPKYRLFVTAILSGMSQTKAAIAAGYSEKSARTTGTDIMKNPAVLAAIDHYEQSAQAASEVDERWILERLRLEATSMLNSGADRIHSLDLLGKYFGMWGGDGVTVTIGASPELEALPLAELRAMVEARRALAAGEGPGPVVQGNSDVRPLCKVDCGSDVAHYAHADVEPTDGKFPAVMTVREFSQTPDGKAAVEALGMSEVEPGRVNLAEGEDVSDG